MQQISFEGQVERLMADGSQYSFGAIIQGGVFNDQSPFVLRSSGVNVSLKTGLYHHNTNPIPAAVFRFVQVAFCYYNSFSLKVRVHQFSFTLGYFSWHFNSLLSVSK